MAWGDMSDASSDERNAVAPGSDHYGCGNRNSSAGENVLAHAPARHVAALGAACHALAQLRKGEQASGLSVGLTGVWRRHLGPLERLFVAVSLVESLEPKHRRDLAFALDPWPFSDDDPFRERSRQRCADAFLEMSKQDRREFLTMARGLA